MFIQKFTNFTSIFSFFLLLTVISTAVTYTFLPAQANAQFSAQAVIGTKFIQPDVKHKEISTYPYTLKWEPRDDATGYFITIIKESESESINKALSKDIHEFTPTAEFWPKDNSEVKVILATYYNDKPTTNNWVYIKSLSDNGNPDPEPCEENSNDDDCNTNSKAVLTNPDDGDTITEDDFDPKLNIQWELPTNYSTNVKKYVLELKPIEGDEPDEEELEDDEDWWFGSLKEMVSESVGNIIGKTYTKTLSKDVDHYDLSLSNFPKSRNIQISIKTYYTNSSSSNSIETSSVQVVNEANWVAANRRISIKSPDMFDTVSSVPVVEYDEGENVKSAKINFYNSFSTKAAYSDDITVGSDEYKISTSEWAKLGSFVTIEIVSTFKSGGSPKRDSVIVKNAYKGDDSSYKQITIESPANKSKVNSEDFPLTVELKNSDQDNIQSATVRLYATNLTTDEPLGVTEQDGKTIVKKPFRSFTLSKQERDEKLFEIDESDWEFDSKFVMIRIETKFKKGPTKDSYVTLENSDSSDQDDDDDNNEGDIVIDNMKFAPSTITVEPGESIKIANNDNVTHTITSDDDDFDTGNIASGDTDTLKAPTVAGTYNYHCKIHPNMKGKIIVKDTTDNGDGAEIESPNTETTVSSYPVNLGWNLDTNSKNNFKNYKISVKTISKKTCTTYSCAKSKDTENNNPYVTKFSTTITNVNTKSYKLSSSTFLKDGTIHKIELITNFKDGGNKTDKIYVKASEVTPFNAEISIKDSNPVKIVTAESISKADYQIQALSADDGCNGPSDIAKFTSVTNGGQINSYTPQVYFIWSNPNKYKTVFRFYHLPSKYKYTDFNDADIARQNKKFVNYINPASKDGNTNYHSLTRPMFPKYGYYDVMASIETKNSDGSYKGVCWAILKTNPDNGSTGGGSTVNKTPKVVPLTSPVTMETAKQVCLTDGANIKDITVKVVVSGGANGSIKLNGKNVKTTSGQAVYKYLGCYPISDFLKNYTVSNTSDHKLDANFVVTFRDNAKPVTLKLSQTVKASGAVVPPVVDLPTGSLTMNNFTKFCWIKPANPVKEYVVTAKFADGELQKCTGTKCTNIKDVTKTVKTTNNCLVFSEVFKNFKIGKSTAHTFTFSIKTNYKDGTKSTLTLGNIKTIPVIEST